jgi:hypothetical protein
MSIFPFIDTTAIKSGKQQDLPMLREYAYDFADNRLLLTEDGKTYLVEGNAALRIWMNKALTTARYRFTAYSPAYGCEYEDNLIGKPIAGDVAISELQRYIVECLMVNPYIKELGEFAFQVIGEGVVASFNCLSIYGEEALSFTIKGVNL